MRAYIVYCHPDPQSFTSAVRQRAVAALRGAGHEVRISDLYADDFEPAKSLQVRLDHSTPPEHMPGFAGYWEQLQWCDVVVFIYPTWWSGQPAMLTGWLEHMVVSGVALDLADGTKAIAGRLTNVRRLIAITSHGSSRFVNVLEGETGRRVIGRAVRVLCHRLARTTWLALYDIDRSTAEGRQGFLNRVEHRLRRL